MSSPFFRPPHTVGPGPSAAGPGPNAALLIDFDNVTMGMRSDLSKELKRLLDSDIIKGKVAVQRAYADWRRYPQYIVPLSEASIDLIFAPAYGSSKKNATDIRMAIDALELIFVRPEIGTFILLTGDSDFSSLVLKLKEYGKYVIGVGIQESSSDILVQNCDEYYSYTSLAGLKKSTEDERTTQDPWELVQKSLEKMVARSDVMRSDRLKQVMIELDPGFDEHGHGFKKFSKFLAEASSKGLVDLKKMDNGQYEVSVPSGGGRSRRGERGRERGGRDRDRGERGERSARGGDRGRRRRNGGPSGGDTGKAHDRSRESGGPEGAPRDGEQLAARTTGGDAYHDDGDASGRGTGGDPLQAAYALVGLALDELAGAGRMPARDSDVKRRLIKLGNGFDETELGFGKFSKFLAQAEADGVVTLSRNEHGQILVSYGEAGADDPGPSADDRAPRTRGAPRRSETERPKDPLAAEHREASPTPDVDATPVAQTEASPASHTAASPASHTAASPASDTAASPAPDPFEVGPDTADEPERLGLIGRLMPRLVSRRRRTLEGAPPIFEGQAVASETVHQRGRGGPAEPKSGARNGPPAGGRLDAAALGLPTDPDAIVAYLSNSYRGVGRRTAESAVEAFGADVYRVLRDAPERLHDLMPPHRADQLVEAWAADYERRSGHGDGSDDRRGHGDPGGR